MKLTDMENEMVAICAQELAQYIAMAQGSEEVRKDPFAIETIKKNLENLEKLSKLADKALAD